MTNEAMGELLKAMETAGGKSDRWLFIAMVIVLIAASATAVLCLWKFVQQLRAEHKASTEKLMSDHSESTEKLMAHHKASRDASQEALKKIANDQNETMRNVAVVLDRNTCALEGNGEILTACKEELKRCHDQRGTRERQNG